MNAVSEPRQNIAWQELLRMAIKALDALSEIPDWTWGGGTALATQIDHRKSYDIDIFLSSSEALRNLSPNRNEVSREITDLWQEPGHYIKLERPEGEIDFIVASARTPNPTKPYDFEGREIRRETPAEILAKKLHYRGSTILARDVFDIAAVRILMPDQFEIAVHHEPKGAIRVADELRRRPKRFSTEMPTAVNPTEIGNQLVCLDPLEIASALSDVVKTANPHYGVVTGTKS